jgi:hypothetical protein
VTKFQVIRDILALGGVTAQQKLVLIAMNQYGDDGRNVYPAIETVAGMASMSPRNAARHIRALRNKGYLIATGKSRRNTINYRMAIPHDTAVTRTMTAASLPNGHQRHTTTLNNIPSRNPSRLGESYYDSHYDSPNWSGDRTTRKDDAVSVQKRLAAYRLRNHGR